MCYGTLMEVNYSDAHSLDIWYRVPEFELLEVQAAIPGSQQCLILAPATSMAAGSAVACRVRRQRL